MIDDEDTDALLRAGSVTCEIVYGFPAAIKIVARDLRPGDLLFDAYGGTHALESVRRRQGWVDVTRADGWPDRFHGSDIITIIRPTEND